ncbi:hypothetical protein Scep_005449 [Stephania cephalantha]|uniref:DUF7722 domain-containing protein n=1 Tax=Stephania cephalantha TaxID=152367 RepID=A0AAP0PXH8_9MAGN
MEKNSGCYFKMPLHYPRYTKKDYQEMPEWKLNGLLAEYGLGVEGNLAYKREFAMGAFLWPDVNEPSFAKSSASRSAQGRNCA